MDRDTRAALRSDLLDAAAEGLGASAPIALPDRALRHARIFGQIRATILPRILVIESEGNPPLKLEVANGRILAMDATGEGGTLAPLSSADLSQLTSALEKIAEQPGPITRRSFPIPDGRPTFATGIAASQLQLSEQSFDWPESVAELFATSGQGIGPNDAEATAGITGEGEILIVGADDPAGYPEFEASNSGRRVHGCLKGHTPGQVVAAWAQVLRA
ncbi:hypothetical protein [Vannielia litorea]|uniref:hypothetical protein n=1 Tax=Vannielia litorea TaxID=1217970 RepID=UPI001C951F28|nr:hypothetical protein [Vannielia litorea]MBY6047848.1 hypothetical protein [Vannielia litorea]MBY6075262.1 hypothetical protein [Vannielia litorea]